MSGAGPGSGPKPGSGPFAAAAPRCGAAPSHGPEPGPGPDPGRPSYKLRKTDFVKLFFCSTEQLNSIKNQQTIQSKATFLVYHIKYQAY